MYRQICYGAAVVMLMTLMYACGETQANGKKINDTSGSRAKQGDSVWVLLNHIKADQRKSFEAFVEKFWDASAKLSESDQRVFRQTRVLYPIEAESDGSFTYIYVMDPAVPGGDYDIARWLEKMYGKETAKTEMEKYYAMETAPQTSYMMVQSRIK